MKKEFEIKNFLGNSQKRTYRREVVRYFVGGVAWCLFLITFLVMILIRSNEKTSPSALGQTIDNNMIVEAVEKNPICKDAISCIRDIGENLGKSNTEIRTMIRIAQKESNMNPLAKNRTSSASGLFQIIAGTWYSNNCVGDKWNYKDNIICAWKIQSGAGYRAWEVCNNGSADCF